MNQPTNPPPSRYQPPLRPPYQPGGYIPPAGPPPTYRGPAKHAHGGGYWLAVGWWWEPLKWLGRISLWLLFWPVGLWRSLRRSRKNREARERRGG